MNPKAYSYIRMSTPEQLKGDSLRRQEQDAIKYAAERGLELQEQDQLRDLGISAFTGANVAEGALGRFLDAVRGGRIEQGSCLIVESLDRLSRQNPFDAFSIFSEIVRAGIRIITLSDKQEYTNSNDLGRLVTSLVSMSRAHEESQMKSLRLSAAWKNKRAKANTAPLTKKCPAWLELKNNKFVVVPDRAKIIKRIFNENANGIGAYSIAKRLNDDSVPTFSGKNSWFESYVTKILSHRTVTGAFQPHKFVNGKRIADGEEIPNYFPRIIDDELFYRVQQVRTQRKIKGGGRKGANISNLFSGIAYCQKCHSKMRFVNKTHHYLTCIKCKQSWRYTNFESAFLQFVEELDINGILNGASQERTRLNLANEIEALKGKSATIQEKMNVTFELLDKQSSDFLGKKLREMETEQASIATTLQKKQEELQASKFKTDPNELKEVIRRVQNTNDDAYKIRAQIAAKLRTVVEKVFLKPATQTFAVMFVNQETRFVATDKGSLLFTEDGVKTTITG
jgi:DNA invertase Pin-like site-specific DNA recombinase